MFSIGNKAWILKDRKTDGRYNKGVIVEIEKEYPSLGFMTEAQYFRDFREYRYKVAYVDVFTKRAGAEWVYHTLISKTKPTDAPE